MRILPPAFHRRSHTPRPHRFTPRWMWRCLPLVYWCGVAGAWAGTIGGGGTSPGSVATQPAARQAAPAPSGASVPASLTVQTSADIAARLAAADCKSLRLDPASLAALQQTLHPLGLAIRVLGCPEAPTPLGQRVLAVTAVVLDGDKAMDTVRGALGDGEPVDMGSDYHPSPWPSRQRAADLEVLDDNEVSPDVQFNRRWLRSVMASQGYASVTGPWWAFIPVQQRRR